MADKQLVPFSFEAKAVVPFEKEAKPLASLPPDHLPLSLFPPSRPRSPPWPTRSKKAMYAQSYREAAQKKPICVPSHMDLKKPRDGERLIDVWTSMATQGCISTPPPQAASPSTEFVLKNLRSRESQSSKPASGCRRNKRPERP
jgi:hypothetical protein